jgi:hypothetical protein
MANCVAMNFIPVTTCTDLLQPGGYARLIRYMEELGEKMHAVEATRIPDFVIRHCGQRANAHHWAMQAIVDSLRGQFVGAKKEQIARIEAWLEADVLSLLKAYGAAPQSVPIRDVCQQITGKFEERVSTFPPAMVDALRGTIAGLEQALVDTAGVLNTPILVKEATENPRYTWERNQGVPQRLLHRLQLRSRHCHPARFDSG